MENEADHGKPRLSLETSKSHYPGFFAYPDAISAPNSLTREQPLNWRKSIFPTKT